MIPLALSLRNFLCYGEDAPTLHLEGMHVVCLCGPNGHGKSSLLDAITWALWGRARADSQDELIHQGQRDMYVSLDFEARGQRYRVVRRHERRGRGRQGVTSLELQVASGNGFRPISGNSVRETEAKVRDILSMDYQTFINSAYLRQGDADRFTKAGPAERKRVLAEILNLSLYDRLQDRAKERASQREGDIRAVTGEMERIRAEVERRPEYQEQLARVEAESASIKERLDAQQGEVQRLWESLQHLMERQDRLREVLGAYNQLVQEQADLRGQVQREGQRLSQEAGFLERRVAEGEERLKRAEEARLELARLASHVEEMDAREAALQQQEQELTDLALRIQQARAEMERIKHEGKDLRERLQLLHAADHQDTRCPLCNTQLGEEGRRNLAASYETQIAEKRQAYRHLHAEVREREERHRSLKATVEQGKRGLEQQRRQLQEREARLKHQAQEAEAAGDALADDQARLQAIREALAREDYSVEERQRLSRVEEELARVVQEKEALEREVMPLPDVQSRFEQAQRQRDDLARQREPLLAQAHSLRAQLERCDQLERELGKKQRTLASLTEERGIFADLVTAFGKGGIQALLIESAVPELEAEANDLLSRLTDGRMHLKLETQRERRSTKGDPIETLEILISDELGTRSYETFSGGEAFRINFSLRIALSKLLARRSGAPLPTLFIDEGFGTQDTAGRERLVEAIRAIQDHFQRIVVITHIDELKEAFPNRIEVSKTERGSTFWVV